MRYNVATIDCGGCAEWQVEVLMQKLADCGFDSFEQEDCVLKAYIPVAAVENSTTPLTEVVANAGAKLLSFEECDDANWNEVWESEHIVEELPLGVRIVPHCAFGAGHHETTAMMIDELCQQQPTTTNNGKDTLSNVLDMGTGTGVLGILAVKLGAQQVVAVDIDENSVRNACENAAANGVTLDVRLGSNVPEGQYSLIMANIHRNILLTQMPDYARCLSVGGKLWLSGFYEQDVPALIAEAERHELHHLGTRANGEWRMLLFAKK